MAEIEKVNPIEIEGNGKRYVLDFDRESADWAERRGFNINDLDGRAMMGMSDLFYYSFRKNHPQMTKAQTDHLLFDEDGLGGMPDGMAERLAQLYTQTYNALVQTEEKAKNSKWTVKM